MLYYTLIVLSVRRLSKKPGVNKTKKSKQVSQKYTAARLHEKGVLIAIEDLQPNQYDTQLHIYYTKTHDHKLELCFFTS